MKRLRVLLADRSRRQRGSILSGLLIMVALLSILIGALMTELSSSFLVSNTLSARVQREATDNSAVELGLYQLAKGAVPPVCVRDARGPWFVASLNGNPAAVTESCTAIVPSQSQVMTPGGSLTDGVREVTSGHDSYLVGQGALLRSYAFGTTALEWSINTGGAITGPAMGQPDPNDSPDVELMVPDASTSTGCGGHCVQLYSQRTSGAPSLICDMAADATVTGQPAAEAAGSGSPHFPSYAFFGDSAGNLYVYDAGTDGTCGEQANQAGLGGAIVGQPLVFTGTSTSKGQVSTLVADVFVVVTSATSTQLQEWQYSETTDKNGDVTKALTSVSSVALGVGGRATVSEPTSGVPVNGSTIRLAVAGASGRMAIAQIRVGSSKSGPVYTISAGATSTPGGPVAAAPYWCHCPAGDAIGVGSTNGTFYLLDTNLNLTHVYVGQAAIHSTPSADSNGDWYYGADDGNVYDVEVPSTGVPLFKAAQFGPGGAIRSSPVVGSCSGGPCVYFASTTSGDYFVHLGSARIMDLRACVTTSPASVTCAANPRLWARAAIGPASVVGGTGIVVQGWSYYSP